MIAHTLLAAIGFDLYIPRESLKAALLISFLSVWVLVGLFSFLNRYTRRRYFTLWTVAWLFYALWLLLTFLWVDSPQMGQLFVWKQWCLGVMAVFLFWGALVFREVKINQRVIAGLILFLLLWSFVGNSLLSRLPFEAPLFAMICVVCLGSSYNFLRLRKKHRHIGAGLLAAGFALWGVFFALFPFLSIFPELFAVSFFLAAILQLFIAVSMIILALEEERLASNEAFREARETKSVSRELETRMISSEDRYRRLFEQASEGIVIVDIRDFAILEVNRAGESLLGLSRSSRAAAGFGSFCQLPSGGERLSGEDLLKLICGQRPLKIVKRNGEAITCEADGAVIDFEGRKACQIFLREMTERARLEQQLRQSEKLYALGQIISGVAHELNNPLAVIKGYLELILTHHAMSAQTRSDLEKVATQAHRAAKLVKNFLTFARDQTPEKKMVNLNELILRVSDLRKFDLLIIGAELETCLDPHLPMVLADEDQIQQALMNLFSNSLQAVVETGRAPVFKLSSRTRGDAILLAIEDNGPGVSREIQDKIFEPFFTTKSVGSGAGLGLSIAHSILADHQGRLSYYTPSQGGAGFLIELPRVSLPKETSGSPPPSSRASAPDSPRYSQILVLDDEKAIAELIAEMLSLLGHFPVVANSPPQALHLLEEQKFDLVLSDYRMPMMNGKEFYTVLCEKKPELSKKIIFVTGDVVNEETVAFLREAGAPYLAKPFELTALQERIAEVLNS